MSAFLKRLSLAAVVAAIVAPLAGTGPAAAQTPIKFSLDWRYEGPAAPFLIAMSKGYFKAEGLDVTIDQSAGSVEPINRVASGTYDMGFGDINSLIKFRDQNPAAGLKAVYMVYNKPSFAVVGRKSLGITKPKDLEGKTLGAPAADGGYAQWPIFTQANGIDASKVKIDNVGFPVREPMLAQGRVDAVTGFSFSVFISLRDAGVPAEDIAVLLMADHGLKLYGNTIFVGPAFAQKNPEAVKGFLRAFTKAVKDAIADPAAGAKLVVAANPVVKEASETDRLKMALAQNIVTDEVKKNGLGTVDMARLTESIEQIGLTYKFTAKPKAEDIFDASYLPADNKL